MKLVRDVCVYGTCVEVSLHIVQYGDRTNPIDKHVEVMMDKYGLESSPMTSQMFGNAGREHMEKYGKDVTQCNIITKSLDICYLLYNVLIVWKLVLLKL